MRPSLRQGAWFVLMVLVMVPTAKSEFERKGLKSSPAHHAANWFRMVHADSANVDSVMHWMRHDTSLLNGQRSLESYEAKEWIRENLRNADASGWIRTVSTTSPAPSPKHVLTVQGAPTWRNLGPFTWDREAVKSTGSEGIGVLRSIAIHPRTPETILVGTISAGVWRSTDAGDHWQPVTDALFAQQADDVEFAPSDASTVYAALDVGLARSTDAGRTFSMTSLDSRDQFPYVDQVSLVSVHPTDPQHVVVAYKNALHESTDGGATWRDVPSSDGAYWSVTFSPTGNVIYAVRKGNNWSEYVRFANGAAQTSKGLPVQTSNAKTPRALLATSAAAPTCVWVMYGGSIDTVGGVWGLYKSTDNGLTFSHLCCGEVDGPEMPSASNPNMFDYNSDGLGLGQITWDMAFAISNTDTSLMVVAGIFPFISKDGGRTWSKCSPIHYDVQDAILIDRTLWVSTDGGLQRSDDLGTNMRDRSEGICAVEVWGFGQSPLQNIMALGAYHLPVFIRDDKLYDHRGYEGGWYPWSGADAMMADVNPDENSWIYAKPWTSVRARRAKTKHVPPIGRELGIDLGYLPFSNLAFHPNKTYTIIAADHAQPAIMRTDDNAESWQIIKPFTTSISHVRIAPSHPTALVTIADAGVWYTADGDVWMDITPPATIAKSWRVVDVAFDPHDHHNIWVAYSGRQRDVKVAFTTDGGTSWTDQSTGLLTEQVNCLTLRPAGETRVLVGTTSGVYSLNERTGSWAPYGSDLPRCGVYFLQPDEAQGLLRIGTTRGIWETSIAPGVPRAQISVETDTVRCYSDDVLFTDRSSTYLNASAWRRWSFPGGDPPTSTERQPHVHYTMPGAYSVSLTIGNAYGTDSTSLENVVTVLPSECDVVSPYPGGCVDLSDADDFVTLGTFTGTTSTFTFTAWVKPNGIQPSFSAIFCTDVLHDYVGEIGMQIVGDSNEIGYLWKDGQWWWHSGLRLIPDQWNHVAMMVNGAEGITLMVNGRASRLAQPAVVQDLSKLTFTLGTYHGWAARNLNAQIDEVRLFRSARTVDEVRKEMHHPTDPDHTDLLAWYQFNETGGSTFFDARGAAHGSASLGATRVPSTIPFGLGHSDTVRVPTGDQSLITTVGINARVQEVTGMGVQLVRIDQAAPRYGGPVQLLQPRYYAVQTLDEAPSTLVSVTMDLHGLIGWQDAPTRTYHLWSATAYDPASTWTELPCKVYQDAVLQQVTFKLTNPLPARNVFCISADGTPVGVPEVVEHLELWPMPVQDVLHVGGVAEGESYILVDVLGQPVFVTTASTSSIVIPVAHLPQGMYLLLGTESVTAVPVVR